MPRSITNISISKFPAEMQRLGLKPYAVDQILGWLYKYCVESFDEMTNLSRPARSLLKDNFEITSLNVIDELKSEDGTRKFLFKLNDGETIESVLIPAADGRQTLCVSTQVGCSLGCLFCRTAKMGFKRNLSLGEILGQVVYAKRIFEVPLTNIVFMGMGEPLLNLENVCDAIEILLLERAFCFSKRRITLSTCGLLPQLKQLSSRFDIKIAISLNASDDETRNCIMPVNKKYPLAEIMNFCREYCAKSKHRITFEYVLLGGINDTLKDAARIIALLKGIRAKVNLIPFNPFSECEFRAPSTESVLSMQEYLVSKGIHVNIRASRGQDILAACGQLASKQN